MAEAATSLDHRNKPRITVSGLILAAALFIMGWAGAHFYFIPNFPWLLWPLVYLLPGVPGQWSDARTLWGGSALACLLALMLFVGWFSTSRNQRTLLLWPAIGLVAGEFVGGNDHWIFLYNTLLEGQYTSYSYAVAEFVGGLATVLTSALIVFAAAALGMMAKDVMRGTPDEPRNAAIRKRTIVLLVASGLAAGFLGSASDYGFSYVFLGLHLSPILPGPYYSSLSTALSLGLIAGPAVVIAASYLVGRNVMPALGHLAVLFSTFVAALWGFLLGFVFFTYETVAANVGPARALSYLSSKLGEISGNAPAAASFALWLSLVGLGAFSIPYLVRQSE